MTTDPHYHMGLVSDEPISVEEYFRLDYSASNEKYEYQDGAARLMSGGSGEHDDIAFNIRVALKQHFQSSPYFVKGSDMRVKISETAYFYPDVTVSCDIADRRRGNKLIRSPRIVIEVLSPSTEKKDRTDKLRDYQACASIQEIVLISQFAPHVEVFRRSEQDKKSWNHVFYKQGEVIALESVDVHIPIEEIYEGIDFDEPLVEE